MSSDSAQAADPSPASYRGDSFTASLKRRVAATRPKFFPASVLPVVVGTAWGIHASGQFDLAVFLLALLATVLVHAACNVLNDVGDDDIGTDPQNEDRIFPYTGGSRFIQAGILSSRQMARLGITLLALAAACGLALLALRGIVILYFGLAGIVLGVLYSLGPWRLSSLGLGETAVAVAFGVIPVVGSAWLQSAAVTSELLLFSIPVSAWVAAILLINEVPDIAADAATGKRTLPVRLGLAGTAMIYLGLHVSAVLGTLWLSVYGPLPAWSALAPAGLLFLGFKAAAAIRVGIADRPAMTKAIESTLAIHTIGSLWLVVCLAVAFFTSA